MRIVQIVRYIECDCTAGPGTVMLSDDGKLYRLLDFGGDWTEMLVPKLPDPIQLAVAARPTLTLKPKAK